MIESEEPPEPVTEWDLALYAEDALSEKRRSEVAEFLRRYPELAEFTGIDPQASADSTLNDGQARAIRDETRATSNTNRRNGLLRPLPGSADSHRWRRNAFRISIVAVVVCFGVGVVTTSRAASPILQQIQQELKQGTLTDDVANLVRARVQLEGLSTLFLSSREKQLQKYLLAVILLKQAESELLSHRLSPTTPGTVSDPPIAELTQQAIDLLTELDNSPEVKLDLARAWALHGRIHYQFLVSNRRTQSIEPKAAAAFLKAYQLMPESEDERWRIASRLMKTLHKSGPYSLVKGNSAEEMLRQTADTFQIEILNPTQIVSEVLTGLAVKIRQAPLDSESGRLAHLEVASILTMASNGRPEMDAVDVEKLADEAIRHAEDAGQDASREHQLLLAQLLGNVADRVRWTDVPNARAYGWKALRILRELAEEKRSEDVMAELAWVTARLLLNEYRFQRKNPQAATRVTYLIGALRQTENRLQHFDTLQLSPWEVDVIHAIEAEVDDPELATGGANILILFKAGAFTPEQASAVRTDFGHLDALKSDPDFQEFVKLEAGQNP